VQNSAKNSHKTSFLAFRVAWLTVLFIGRCVREGWWQLKGCRIPFFQFERSSPFSRAQGLGFLEHLELKHVLQQVVLLGPGYSCTFSSVLGLQITLPVHRCRFSPPAR